MGEKIKAWWDGLSKPQKVAVATGVAFVVILVLGSAA